MSTRLFTNWLATIFEDYADEQFQAGIEQLIEELGAQLSDLKLQLQRTNNESDSDDDSDEPEIITPGVDLNSIWAELDLETICGQLLTESPHPSWRSLKARSMVLSMIQTAQDLLVGLLAKFEAHRRRLTRKSGVDIDETIWPPASAAATQVARRVVPEAWELAEVELMDHKLRKRLVREFVGRVNSAGHATAAIRNQMQAMVLEVSNKIIELVADTAVPELQAAVQTAL